MSEQNSASGRIRRAEIIAALSLATDLAIGQPMELAMRATVLAMRLGRSLGLPDAELTSLYWFSLLRHVGCHAEGRSFGQLVGDEVTFHSRIVVSDPTNIADLVPLMARMIWQTNTGAGLPRAVSALVAGLAGSRSAAKMMVGSHCDVAMRLARRLGSSDAVIEALGKSEERWNGAGLPAGLKGESIPRIARIGLVALDYVAMRLAMPLDRVLANVRKRARKAYDPVVATELLGGHDTLAADFADAPTWDLVLLLEPQPVAYFDAAAVEEACTVIADFADLKDPLILGHSRAVAELAGKAAEITGLPAAEAADVRLAGLLHDIGYSAIPARVRLSGEGATESERERLRLHGYFGERILVRSPALARLGALVSAHHERMDGSGFHRGVRGPEINVAARILAAAEAFQGLVEGRGGHAPRSRENAAAVLREEMRAGRLDVAAGEAVLAAAGQPSRRASQAATTLSPREIEVLKLVARGSSAKQVARALAISPKTARNHIQNIYAKAGVTTRAAAALYALENGIIVPGG
jgi:HD-GYP domain-containing protein (c-di-GMP phosphodiesterase class II)